MDVENDYFEKDKDIEDTTEDFIIELSEDDSMMMMKMTMTMT